MIRSALRAVGYVVSELIPAQAIRCVLDRDYADAMYDAGAKHDGTEQLAEREAEEEVMEPAEADIRAFTISSLLQWMQAEKRTEVRVQCGHCLQIVDGLSGFATHMLTCDLEPKSSAAVPRKGPADGPPGLTHSPESPGGHLIPTIAQVIRDHRLWRNAADGSGECECDAWKSDYPITDHPEHLAEQIAACLQVANLTASQDDSDGGDVLSW